MPKVVKLSDEVVKQLDKLRHIGQSYDGVLREVLKKHDKSRSPASKSEKSE